VVLLVETEGDLRAANQDRAADQVRVLHHEIDRFLLRLRQRPLLEDRAARAHEVEEPIGIDVLFEEGAIRRVLVDVDLRDVEPLLVQETPGVLAGGSGRFGIERRLGHGRILPIAAQRRLYRSPSADVSYRSLSADAS